MKMIKVLNKIFLTEEIFIACSLLFYILCYHLFFMNLSYKMEEIFIAFFVFRLPLLFFLKFIIYILFIIFFICKICVIAGTHTHTLLNLGENQIKILWSNKDYF